MWRIKGCIFCNALPLTELSYNSDLSSQSKDFIKSYREGRIKFNKPNDWKAYYADIVKPYLILKSAFSNFGIRFYDECTFTTFKEIIEAKDVFVVILFSHCINNGTPDEQIEFYDHLVKSEDVINVIPDSISRIYDVAVCNPQYFKTQADLLKSNSVFGTASAEISLPSWYHLFSLIFQKSIYEGLNYLAASGQVLREEVIKQRHEDKFIKTIRRL